MEGLPIMLGNGIPIIYRTLSIEIPITSVANNGLVYKFPLNDIINTKGVMVYGIDAFTTTQQTVSPGGAAVVTLAGALGLILTMQDKRSINTITDNPYYTFISSLNTGYIRMIRPFHPVLQNCSIRITDITGLSANQVALFDLLYYTEEDIQIFYDSLKLSKQKQQ